MNMDRTISYSELLEIVFYCQLSKTPVVVTPSLKLGIHFEEATVCIDIDTTLESYLKLREKFDRLIALKETL